MRILKTVLFLAVASLAITACKKGKDKPSTSELLTQKPWVIEKIEERQGNGPLQNVFLAYEDCQKDNQWVFTSSFNFNITEGDNACPGSQPREVLETGTWSLLDNGNKLDIDGEEVVIEELNGSALVISYTEILVGVEHYSRATFKH